MGNVAAKAVFLRSFGVLVVFSCMFRCSVAVIPLPSYLSTSLSAYACLLCFVLLGFPLPTFPCLTFSLPAPPRRIFGLLVVEGD